MLDERFELKEVVVRACGAPTPPPQAGRGTPRPARRPVAAAALGRPRRRSRSRTGQSSWSTRPTAPRRGPRRSSRRLGDDRPGRPPRDAGPVRGQGRGRPVQRVRLSGTIDRSTGRVALNGDLTRLAVSNTLGERLPAPARAAFRRLGADRRRGRRGGSRSLAYDPKARARSATGERRAPRRRLAVRAAAIPGQRPVGDPGHRTASPRSNDPTAATERRPSAPRDESASTTRSGRVSLGIEVVGLRLDERTRIWSSRTFPRAAGLWADFRPGGQVDLDADLARGASGGPIDWGVAVTCRDVAIEYKEFRYPLEHIAGELTARPGRHGRPRSLVGGKRSRGGGARHGRRPRLRRRVAPDRPRPARRHAAGRPQRRPLVRPAGIG